VIGLIAFQWQQYAWGLILVTVFSLGLALVLASIGLMLVRSKEYLNRKPEKHKSPLRRNLEAKLPVFGALVIALLGTAMTLLALLRLDLIDPTTFAV
jgi:ABC-type nickel/cobalt efflux system permease component RcnA